jgi:hypothetical protein
MANGIYIPGTGTLKSSTLPNAFLELLVLIQNEEIESLENEATLTANNIPVPNAVALSVDFEAGVVSATVTALPIEISLVSGNLTINAVNYFAPIEAVVPSVESAFIPTGSSLTKTNLISALLELSQLIQADEEALETPNNLLTMSINTDDKTVAISANFPIIPSLSSTGLIQIDTENYLV